MKNILILGVGSPFIADSIGHLVIEKLKQKKLSKQIELDYLDRPGFYLIQRIRGYDEVHIIDAMIADAPEGSIYHIDQLEMLQKNQTTFSSHDCGVAEALLLGDTLNALPEEWLIHGVVVDGNQPTLSEHIQKNCDALVNQLLMKL